MAKRASGKTRDREQSRARILEAAEIAFTRSGYAGANIRDIAAEADVNVALVIRYFGSKEDLFVAAVSDAFDLQAALAGVPREDLGSVMAELLFGPQGEPDLMAMTLRSAFEPILAARLQALVTGRMLEPLAALIGGAEAEQRAAAVLAMVTGVWVYRFALPIELWAGATNVTERNRIGRVLQFLIGGEKSETKSGANRRI